jgi:hypothetical protein
MQHLVTCSKRGKTQRRTGRLTVGRNVTSTSTITCLFSIADKRPLTVRALESGMCYRRFCNSDVCPSLRLSLRDLLHHTWSFCSSNRVWPHKAAREYEVCTGLTGPHLVPLSCSSGRGWAHTCSHCNICTYCKAHSETIRSMDNTTSHVT